MIVLGLDPGTATTGFGVVEKRAGKLIYVTCGVITTPAADDPPARLKSIYDHVNRLLDEHQPTTVATERLFFTNNTTTGIPVGRALGVVLLAIAQRGLPWSEYTPTQVKNAVVGVGRADKKQVQYMVTRLLGLAAPPRPDDAADALAIAICHAHTLRPVVVKAPVRG
ncbi:MAG: crossover junction endodeoxyribonuclease RuvC [Capsulimonadaceae bacterium]